MLEQYKLQNHEVFSDIQKRLDKVNKLKKNLMNLNIYIKDSFSPFSWEDFANMDYLNKIVNKDSEILKRFTKSTLFAIKINKKMILLFIHKEKHNIEVYNFFGGLYNKIAIFSKNKGKFFRISEYSLLANSQIEDYLNYSEKEIKKD